MLFNSNKQKHASSAQLKHGPINTKKNKHASGAIIPDEFTAYQKQQEAAHPHRSFLQQLAYKFHILGTSKDIDTTGNNQFNHSILDMLGYKALTHDRHQFLALADRHKVTIGYAEILRVGGSSLYNLPPESVERVLRDFVNFLRAFLPDMTFVSIHLPNDSRDQQRFWRKDQFIINQQLYYKRTSLSSHRRSQLLAQRGLINENLNDFRDLDQHMNNQAFVLMIFAQHKRALITDVHYAFQFGAKALKLSFMSEHQKEVFLERLNNPSNDA